MRGEQPNYALWGQGIYALHEQGSNFSAREAESEILNKVGGITNPRELSFADAYHAMIYAALQTQTDKDIIFSADTREILLQQRYNWRNHERLKNVTPETALYLDAFVRLKEFSSYIERLQKISPYLEESYNDWKKKAEERETVYRKVREGFS